MGRVYTVSFAGVAVTAQQDFFELVAAAGKPFRVLGWELSQSSEVADAQEEGLSVILKSGQTTSGSGGSSYTPVPQNASDAAAGITAEINNTTKASAGTIVTHHPTNWNVRNSPMPFWYPEKAQPEIAGGRRMTLELATTPADSITMSGCIWVEEFG